MWGLQIEQIIQPLEQSLNHQNKSSVGIDIENIASLPKTNDFRTEGFYIDNFGEKEIAYCILQKIHIQALLYFSKGGYY
jgi:hypothetical protein